ALCLTVRHVCFCQEMIWAGLGENHGSAIFLCCALLRDETSRLVLTNLYHNLGVYFHACSRTLSPLSRDLSYSWEEEASRLRLLSLTWTEGLEILYQVSYQILDISLFVGQYAAFNLSLKCNAVWRVRIILNLSGII
ncbi:hypothetical protein Ancab_010795, partial [Ancistrocladus abbreviatus]